MFAIMGATGQTGGAVIDALRKRGQAVRAISRDPGRARAMLSDDVEIVSADVGDAASLAAAFHGVEGVYVLNVPSVAASDAIAAAEATSRAIVEALLQARVPHVVALSSEGAHRAGGTGMIRTLHAFEQALLSSGVPTIRVRATYFMENWASGLGSAAADGVLPSFLQPRGRAIGMVSVADIGRAVAALLVARASGDVVNLVGPRDYSPDAAAKALSGILGRSVSVVEPPREAWVPALTAAGLGASYASELAAMYDAINEGRVGYEPGVGRTERGTTELVDALAALDPEAAAQPA